jgi:hypothetical protein
MALYYLNPLLHFLSLFLAPCTKYFEKCNNDAKKATTTGSKLVESKNAIRDLYKRMKSRTITDRLI